MSAASWTRIEALFDEAMMQPPGLRGAWLDQRTGTDDWLRRHVSRLIDQADASHPDVHASPFTTVPGKTAPERLAAGTLVGAWRLEFPITADESRAIYRAERVDGGPKPPGVFELIRLHAAQTIDRFDEERSVLARLDHPGIAKMLDAGFTDDGRPFIVTEWIEGIPLVAWCREKRATLSQRLDLFLQVCEAMDYVHRNLLTHRDLAPHKVLVDAEGRCRVLDLGVAVLRREDDLDACRTRNPMTLAHLAPEQFARETVTPASDVYALGLLLFELLTDERPWHRSQASLSLMRERQLRAEPPSPSHVAAARADAPIHARALRGNLDAIVALALQREPERRYRSATEFADDLRCHLEDRPVRARPDSFGRALRRVAMRHRQAATLVAVVTSAVLATSAVALWKAREARIAAATAQREAARAAAARDFLVDALRGGDPPAAADGSAGPITPHELLDQAVPKIGERFGNDPAMQIELMEMLAGIYRDSGDEARYRALRALQLAQLRRLHGVPHPALIQGLLDEARNANEEGEETRARKRLAEVDPLIRKAGLDDTVTRARWWLLSGGAPRGTGAEGDVAALRKALEMYERLAPMDVGGVEALAALGWREMRGNPAKAEQHFLRAIAIDQKRLIAGGPSIPLSLWSGLAQAREEQGEYGAAIEAYERGAVPIEKASEREDDGSRIRMAQFAWALHRDGQRERALEQFEKRVALKPAESRVGLEDARVRELYADRLAAEGRAREAIPLLEAAVETYREFSRAGNERYRGLLILGDAYERADQSSKARDAIRASLDGRLQADPQDAIAVGVSRERWGRFLLAHDDPAEAKQLFDEVLAQAGERNDETTVRAHGGLARIAQGRKDWDAALASSTHAVVGFENIVGSRDVRTGPYLWLIHAESLRQVDDHASARIWAQRALEASRRYDAPGAASIREAERMLAKIP